MAASSSPIIQSRRLLALAAVVVVSACGGPESDPGTLALFSGGRVTATELEDSVLALPANARPSNAGARNKLYRDLLRQLAIRTQLIDEAKRQDILAEPELEEQWSEMRKQIVVNALLAREVEVAAPTGEQVRSRFDENPAAYGQPERREVFHIFLRPQDGESRAQLGERLRALRARHLAGEPFPLLARQYSESQLREGDGALGWLVPGQLSPRLNDIVFGLEEAVPSDVMMTSSGAHLFYAARVVAAESPTFDDVRQQVRRTVQQALQSQAIEEYVALEESDPGDFVPEQEELRALLAGGDPAAIVLRVGDWTLAAGDLLERLEQELQRRPGRNREEVTHGLLVAMAQRERLATRAFEAGLEQEEAVQESLEAARDRLAFAAIQRRELLARIESDTDALMSYFDREGGRFAGPLRLRVERLIVPLGPGAGAAMAELEANRDALAIGDLSLERLAERVGGSVEEPAWKTLEDLRSEGGNTRTQLVAVPIDGFARPVSNGREIELIHVLDRSGPEVPALENVRGEVKEAYLRDNGVRLYEELVADRLQASGFRVVDENLALFAEQAIGLADPE